MVKIEEKKEQWSITTQELLNWVDAFSLQLLMGHTNIQILRRYLKQTGQDGLAAYVRWGWSCIFKGWRYHREGKR